MIYYFSGTGNSLWVARQLGAALHEGLCNMAQAPALLPLPAAGEAVGLVFPVHAWRPPRLVRRFVAALPRAVGAPYTWAVMTCGDDVGRTPQMLAGMLAARGYKLSLAASIGMPNTYVALPLFDVDRPAVRAAKLHVAVGAVAAVASDIAARRKLLKVRPGALPRVKSHVLGPLFERALMSDHPFRTTPACTGCGGCVRACPVGNIAPDAERAPHWQGHCTMCMACYHHCPQHAIELGHRTRGKGQYYLNKYKNELI